MKIVLTCNYSPWSSYSGGGQRSTHNLACALAKRGHDVCVIFSKPPWERIQPLEPLPYRLLWASLWDHKSRRQAPFRPLTSLSVLRIIKKHFGNEKNFIIHSNGEESAALGKIKKDSGFGLVVTPRYPDLPKTLFEKNWSWFFRKAYMGVFHAKYLALGKALRDADAVSPPSIYAGRLMQQAYGLDYRKIRPVHNGVPVEFLQYRWKDPEPGSPLVFFGRLSMSKGVDTLLSALYMLGERAPRTLIFGRGPMRSRIVRQIRSCGLGDRVSLMGWVDHHQLGQVLSDASMAVIPSREENFSLAVLSAMAVGTPLITTPVGGTCEVVEHETNGLLFEPGNDRELAESIRACMQDTAKAAGFGRRGASRVRRGFTWDTAAQKFEKIYQDIL